MAIQFYINNHQVGVETNAAFTEVLDKVLDSGSIVLEISNIKDAIAPRSVFSIVDTTNNETQKFVVINDTIEIVHKNAPMLYKHNLSLKQDTYAMVDRIVRNSVFSQPLKTGTVSQLIAHGYLNVHMTAGGTFINATEMQYPAAAYSPFKPGYKSTRTYISPREKVSNAEIRIETELTSYAQLQLTTKILDTQPRTPKENIHGQNYLRVYFFQNEDDPDDQYEDYIDVRVKAGQTQVTIPGDFFNRNGTGWYALSFADNMFLFSSLSSSDISFSVNGGTVITATEYPTIQVSVNASLNINTYYYSLWDVLDILRKQTIKTLNGTARQPEPYIMPSKATEKGQTLDSIAAPEFKFNGNDVFSCVSQVMDCIDAIPTLKEDGTLDFEYTNDNSREKITTELMDEQTSLSVDNYSNRVVANYQNGRQATSITYPGKNTWKKVSTNAYGILSADNVIMNTDQPIDYIKHLWIKTPNSTSGTYDLELDTETITISSSNYNAVNFARTNIPHQRVDIASAIVESALYDLLDTIDKTSLTLNKMNALQYQRGSTTISLGGLAQDKDGTSYELYKYALDYATRQMYAIGGVHFNTISTLMPSIYNVQYAIEYYATFNGITTQESTIQRSEHETYIGQTGGNTDLNRVGDNLAGILAKIGNERKNVVVSIRTYNDRIRKGMQINLGDNNRWIVNSVKNTFSTSEKCIINELELVKNFNNKSQYTQIDNEYKLYEINEKLTAKGYEYVNEFIYLSTTSHTAETIAINDTAINTIIESTLIGTPGKKSDLAIVKTYKNESDVTGNESVFIPIHTYGTGNVLNFEMGYESPIKAGDIVTYENSAWTGKAIAYVDETAIADKIIITIAAPDYNSKDIDEYPKVPSPFTNKTDLVTLDYNYYKKPNEILHFNYGVAFIPWSTYTTNEYGVKVYQTEEIYIGSLFMSQNAIIPNSQNDTASNSLHLYTSNEDSDQYSINDRKALGTDRGVATITYDPSTRRIRVTKGTYQCKSWCIADSDKNIYIAVNQNVSASAPYLDLYFIPRKNRV